MGDACRSIGFGVAACLLVAAAPASAEPADAAGAGGRLVWDLSGELDLLGDLWTEIPFRASPRDEIVFALDTRTSIEKTSSSLTFDVRDLDYAIDLGWRSGRLAPSGLAGAVTVGQRGKERVDADGQPWARYVAWTVETPGFSRDVAAPASRRLSFRLLAGPVIERREVEADAVVRGEARWRARPVRPGSSPWRPALDVVLRTDGLIDGDRFEADVAAGPWLVFPAGDGIEAALFLEYQRSRNPLGIGHSALLAGFSFAGPPGARGRAPEPRIDGLVGPGAGDDGRLAGRLLLRLASPSFARELRASVHLDANVLTAEDTGELFYRYRLGLERPIRPGFAGAHFYHRSNHQLAEFNDEVTSINVMEVGFETNGWERPGLPEAGRGPWGLEGEARIGYLIESSFGEERSWHARGGLRWLLPRGARWASPFLQWRFEAGDVGAQSYALGLALRHGLDVQLEYRDDEQYFSGDTTAWLLSASYALGPPPDPRAAARAR